MSTVKTSIYLIFITTLCTLSYAQDRSYIYFVLTLLL